MSTLKTINVQHPSSASSNIVLDNAGGVAVSSLEVNSVPILAGPAFAASDTSTTSTAGVVTKIVFDTETFDTDNAFDGSKFQPNVAGYYNVSMRTGNSGTTNAGVVGSYIYKNGSLYLNSNGYAPAGAGISPALSITLYLNGSTDYVEFYGLNNANANLGSSQASAFLVRAE